MKKGRFLLYFFLIFIGAGCATVPKSSISSSLPMPSPPQGITHVVGTGDTLWKIAKDYGVDLYEILRTNRIQDANQITVGQTLIIPESKETLLVEPAYEPVPMDWAIERRVGPKFPHSDWRSVTVHHSATRRGNAKSFDRDHRRRRMGGLFYHFVIGNGTASRDGEVEVGWRWKKQAEVNRPHDIQICLVGDFNKQRVTNAQFKSLVNLIHLLQMQYDIPLSHVRRHKDIRGKRTECPGRQFPFHRLLAELQRIES